MSFQLTGSGTEIYENTMVPLWFGRWSDALLSLVDLRAGEQVLDLACGTGVTTRAVYDAVAPKGGVTGLDINAGMISKAKSLAGERDIDWTQSDVVAIAKPDACFDVVMSQHGFHYFPEKHAALFEFRRVLRDGGRIALSIWDGHSAYTTAICAAVARHISTDIANQQRSQRDTPTEAALTNTLEKAGFRDVVVVRQELMIAVPLAEKFVPLHLSSMPIAPAFHALDDAGKAALIADVAAAMAPYVVGDQMIYADAVNVVCGLK